MSVEITLYEQIGGESAVALAVDGLYRRLVQDPFLAPIFNGIDMTRLRSHQHAFLSQLLGGPKKYSGAGLKHAHAKLNLTAQHFNAVAGHLVDTLQSLGVETRLIDGIVASLVPLQDQIVQSPGETVATAQ